MLECMQKVRSSMNDIMSMKDGTKLRHKKTGEIYTLHGYVNEYARYILSQKYIGVTDYINKNTQDQYEVAE